MQSLLRFIHQNRSFFVFLVLEISSLWLVFTKNPYHSVAFFNTSNYVVGAVYSFRERVFGHFDLEEENEKLTQENVRLRKQWLLEIERKNLFDKPNFRDSTVLDRYDFLPSVVLKNSVHRENNYFTLNRGKADGVSVGQGVFDPKGVVGIVRSVSQYFSSVYSLLHRGLMVSAIHKKTGELCSVKWHGKSPYETRALYLSRHVRVAKGDTLVTSGFDDVFCKGLPIGVVDSLVQNSNEAYHTVILRFAADFNKLKTVYVVKHINNAPIDSLLTQ